MQYYAAMHFTVELSVRGWAADPSWIAEVAPALDRAGFEAVGYTDHPAPSRKWLDRGGHPTFDPFAALCYVAALTERIRLMTFLAVLPYRNPLLLAKSVATVDRLSSGRFRLVAGTGYLRSEFAALGRSFDQRNDLFEEAVDVLRHAYVADAYQRQGHGFDALGVAFDPPPVQLPHPPIWIGGSSRESRRRAARYGAGWAPMRTNEAFAKVVRTGLLESDDDIKIAVEELRFLVEAEGRDPSEVAVQLDGFGDLTQPADQALEKAAALEALGATHAIVGPPAGPAAEAVEAIERFGAEVIAVR
ncbi:MAG: TIGR03619 family F420-dependent LLM class oxidoreductase [Acidimicrobiaceae bacterium]|nr:TIGR03619 family F420-dependent LLM class oxidoreductase [Acidimicrobiaceae bacterium]